MWLRLEVRFYILVGLRLEVRLKFNYYNLLDWYFGGMLLEPRLKKEPPTGLGGKIHYGKRGRSTQKITKILGEHVWTKNLHMKSFPAARTIFWKNVQKHIKKKPTNMFNISFRPKFWALDQGIFGTRPRFFSTRPGNFGTRPRNPMKFRTESNKNN